MFAFLFLPYIKHVSVYDHSNNVLCALQIMELITLYFLSSWFLKCPRNLNA